MTTRTHIAALMCAGILAAHVSADTLLVNQAGRGDFTTIQAAVDAASNGDLVLVAAGTYTSTHPAHVVDMRGKWITLRSADGPELTTIDGEGARRGVACFSNEQTGVTIEGFTIANGAGVGFDYSGNGLVDFWEHYGGGVMFYSSRPTFVDCVFRNNTAEYGGGGMLREYSSPTFDGCSFLDNSSEKWGGGLLLQGGNPTLVSCLFDGNSSGIGGGAGMYVSVAEPTIENCVFTNNSSISGGAAIRSQNSAPVITGCTIQDNVAGSNAGGLECAYAELPLLTDTIICGNLPVQVNGNYTDNGGNCIAANCTDDNMDGWPDECDSTGDGVHHVPAEFPTIQEAIIAAGANDEVVVAPGTWTSSDDAILNPLGKTITIRSSGGAEVTILDGEGAHFCAQFESGESNATVLDGFTLTGGQGFWGGAIEINGSNPTIQNCILTGNNATRGAGVAVLNGQPVLRACTFTDNTAEFASAVYAEIVSSVLIEDCLFTNNSAQYFAAGVFLQGGSSATIRNCEFLENEADGAPAMSVGFNSTALLEECVFSGNIAATGNTGALSVWDGAATCNSCVFTDNHAAHGGAILCSLGEITLNDCSFSGNSATGDGGAIMVGIDSDATLNACVIQSNSAEGDGGGVFIDSTADVSIADSTICGNQSDQVWGDYDNLGGNAFSEECTQDCLGDIDGNGEVNGGDLGFLLAAFGTSDPAADLDDNGTVNGGDLGLLLSLYGSCQ